MRGKSFFLLLTTIKQFWYEHSMTVLKMCLSVDAVGAGGLHCHGGSKNWN